jgi:hypothetical protein
LEDRTSQTFHFVIVAVTPDGFNRRLLFSVPGQSAHDPAVAPDGAHFAFTISPAECSRCSIPFEAQIMVAGSDVLPVQVTQEGPPSPIDPAIVPDRCAESPSWSPDSSKLVFDDCGHRILVVNADGSNRKQITSLGNYFVSLPVWAAA